MYSLLIKCLQLILVFANSQLLLANVPMMTPNKSEIHLNEGDPLEIICQSFKEITFYYPNSSDVVTSSAIIEQIDIDPYKIKFRRAKTVYGDTGWYGCADFDVNVTPDIYNETNVKWTYVFVKSKSNWFVQTERGKILQPKTDDPVRFECRPTSPEYHVKLLFDHGDDVRVIDIKTRGSFDPKIGFIIDHIKMSDAGYIMCQIEIGTMKPQTSEFQLIVANRQSPAKPVIGEETLSHVVQGQELQVNCSVDNQNQMPYIFEWTTPRNSNRFSTTKYEERTGKNSWRRIIELKINDVAFEDEGEYTCSLRTHWDISSTKMKIKVHDQSETFINLTAISDQTHYESSLGSDIIWVVEVTGYPNPEVRWLDPRNETIINSSKYILTRRLTKMSLKIRSLDRMDMGLYTVEADNKDEQNPRIKRLHFNLAVLSTPLVMDFTHVKPYYEPNEDVKFVCAIGGYPRPDVMWSFRQFSQDPARYNTKIALLENFKNEIDYSQTISTLTMRLETSGNVTCDAHNNFGNDSFTQPVFVSDVPNGFGIIGPVRDIAVGDDVQLICGASIYNFSDSVEWILHPQTEELLAKNNRLSITKIQTPFTYRSILRINNITMSDGDRPYACKATSLDETYPQTIERTLIVNEAFEPYFVSVNMNETENVYNSETARVTVITLECYVDGMPPPVISWWKDDQILNATEDMYIFTNESQVLEIKHPRATDSGIYSCKAENRLNTIQTYQKITIHGEKVSTVLIISIIILLIISVVLVIYFSFKIHREKITRKQLMETGLSHFEKGALECLNPELTVDDQADLLPYDKTWEFPREKLKIEKQLGCGAFGVVMKAKAYGISETEELTTVAVKMVRRSTESTYIRALASELKIMIHLGKHLNVVNLLGACTKNILKRELLVIVEYCRYGNLHNYLLRHRSLFMNHMNAVTSRNGSSIGSNSITKLLSNENSSRLKYADLSFSHSINTNCEPELMSYTSGGDSRNVNTPTDKTTQSNNFVQPGWRSNYRGDYKDENLRPICIQDLLLWAFQVGHGMEYLSQRKVLHGDLAARNILLADDNVVKICDFGLAKTMYKDENYKKKSNAPLPIKWMAIESIRDGVFSTQSDVWSFGIVLWEFFTCAETPYPGIEAEKQYQKLITGYRMEKPELCTREIYDIMLRCWEASPDLRPTFSDLVHSIGNFLDESVKMHYLNLNAPYMNINSTAFGNGRNDYLTMMSAPDHKFLSSHSVREYVNMPMSLSTDYTNICSTMPNLIDEVKQTDTQNILEQSDINSLLAESKTNINLESDANEVLPIFENNNGSYSNLTNAPKCHSDNSQTPQTITNTTEENKMTQDNLGYLNVPQQLQSYEIDNNEIFDEVNTNKKNVKDEFNKNKLNNYPPEIFNTQYNYINISKHKEDYNKPASQSFTNPSYIFLRSRSTDATKV